MLIVGATDSGKSTLILNMLLRMMYFTIHNIVYFCSPHVDPENWHEDHDLLRPFVEIGKMVLCWNITGENSVLEALNTMDAARNKDRNIKPNLIVIGDFGAELCSPESSFFPGRLVTMRHHTKENCVAWCVSCHSSRS